MTPLAATGYRSHELDADGKRPLFGSDLARSDHDLLELERKVALVVHDASYVERDIPLCAKKYCDLKLARTGTESVLPTPRFRTLVRQSDACVRQVVFNTTKCSIVCPHTLII